MQQTRENTVESDTQADTSNEDEEDHLQKLTMSLKSPKLLRSARQKTRNAIDKPNDSARTRNLRNVTTNDQKREARNMDGGNRRPESPILRNQGDRVQRMRMLNEASPSKPSGKRPLHEQVEMMLPSTSQRTRNSCRKNSVPNGDGGGSPKTDFLTTEVGSEKLKSMKQTRSSTPLRENTSKSSRRKGRSQPRKAKQLRRTSRHRFTGRKAAGARFVMLAQAQSQRKSDEADEDSEWESATDEDKPKAKKRLRSHNFDDGTHFAEQDSMLEGQLMIDMDDTEEAEKRSIPMEHQLEKTIAKGCSKNNLSVNNVKKIIRMVVTHDLVKEMLRTTLKGPSEDIPSVVYEPKLTRSKMKEVLEKRTDPGLWPVSPVKLGQPATPGPSILDVEFTEDGDEEDDEYEPSKDLEFVESDDESVTSSRVSELGDIGSPVPFGSPRLTTALSTPSTPTTPTASTSLCRLVRTAKHSPAESLKPAAEAPSGIAAQPERMLSPMAPPSALPTYLQSTKKRLSFVSPEKAAPTTEEEEGIARRTRSKLPLTSTSLYDIEEAFVAPDITPDMYDTNCDDTDWQEFLKGLQKSEVPDLINESIEQGEEDDPEFNYIAEAETEEVVAEEERFDGPFRVTRKELNSLLEELEDLFNEDDCSMIDLRTNLASAHENAALLSRKSDGSTSVSCLLNEEQVSQVGGEEEEDGVDVGAPPDSQPQVLPGAGLIGTDDPMIEDEQVRLVQHQMRLHVQLTTQMYVLAQGSDDYCPYAEPCKKLLKELDMLRRASVAGSQSVYGVCNLRGAVELVERDIPWALSRQEHAMAKLEKEKDNAAAGARKRILKWPRAAIKYRTCGLQPQLLDIQKEVMWNSPVFLYPRVLPKGGLLSRKAVTYGNIARFNKWEDRLLILGREQFNHLHNQTYKLIHQYMMPCKTISQMRNHFSKVTRTKGTEIHQYLKMGKLPDMSEKVEEFTLDKIKAPCDQPLSFLPPWCKKYKYDLASRKENGPGKNTENARNKKRPREQPPRQCQNKQTTCAHSGRKDGCTGDDGTGTECTGDEGTGTMCGPPTKVARMSSRGDEVPEASDNLPAIVTTRGIYVPLCFADTSKIHAAAKAGHFRMLTDGGKEKAFTTEELFSPRCPSCCGALATTSVTTEVIAASMLRSKRVADRDEWMGQWTRGGEQTCDPALPSELGEGRGAVEEPVIGHDLQVHVCQCNREQELNMCSQQVPVARDEGESVHGMAQVQPVCGTAQKDIARCESGGNYVSSNIEVIQCTDAPSSSQIFPVREEGQREADHSGTSNASILHSPKERSSGLADRGSSASRKSHVYHFHINGDSNKLMPRLSSGSSSSKENSLSSANPTVSCSSPEFDVLQVAMKQILGNLGPEGLSFQQKEGEGSSVVPEVTKSVISLGSIPQMSNAAPGVNITVNMMYSADYTKPKTPPAEEEVGMENPSSTTTEDGETGEDADHGEAGVPGRVSPQMASRTVSLDDAVSTTSDIGDFETANQTSRSGSREGGSDGGNGSSEFPLSTGEAQPSISGNVSRVQGTELAVEAGFTSCHGSVPSGGAVSSVSSSAADAPSVEPSFQEENAQGSDEADQSVKSGLENFSRGQSSERVRQQNASSERRVSRRIFDGLTASKSSNQQSEVRAFPLEIGAQNGGPASPARSEDNLQPPSEDNLQPLQQEPSYLSQDVGLLPYRPVKPHGDMEVDLPSGHHDTEIGPGMEETQSVSGDLHRGHLQQAAAPLTSLSCAVSLSEQKKDLAGSPPDEFPHGADEDTDDADSPSPSKTREQRPSIKAAQHTTTGAEQDRSGSKKSLKAKDSKRKESGESHSDEERRHMLLSFFHESDSNGNRQPTGDASSSVFAAGVALPRENEERAVKVSTVNQSDNNPSRDSPSKPVCRLQAENESSPPQRSASDFDGSHHLLLFDIPPMQDASPEGKSSTSQPGGAPSTPGGPAFLSLSLSAARNSTAGSSISPRISLSPQPSPSLALVTSQNSKSPQSSSPGALTKPSSLPTSGHDAVDQSPTASPTSSLRPLAPKAGPVVYPPPPCVPRAQRSSPKRQQLQKRMRSILPRGYTYELKATSPTKAAARTLKKKATLFCQRSPTKALPLLPRDPSIPQAVQNRRSPRNQPSGSFAAVVSSLPRWSRRGTSQKPRKGRGGGKGGSAKEAGEKKRTERKASEEVSQEESDETGSEMEDSAALSQEDSQNEEEAADDGSYMNDLMAASTTIGFNPYKKVTSDKDGLRSKKEIRREQKLSLLAPDVVDTDPRKDDRDTAYAQAYLNKVKLAMQKDPATYAKFMELLRQFETTQVSPVEMYETLNGLLSGYPELKEEFAAFMLPGQALQTNCHIPNELYGNVRAFLRKLELHFGKSEPKYLKVLRWLGKWDSKKKCPEQLREMVLPLMRSLPQHLHDDFMRFFPDVPPPENHMESEDFEDVRLGSEEEGRASPDDFEDIQFVDENDPYRTKHCPCPCHSEVQGRRNKEGITHCYSCCLRVVGGQLYFQPSNVTTRRPVSATFHDPVPMPLPPDPPPPSVMATRSNGRRSAAQADTREEEGVGEIEEEEGGEEAKAREDEKGVEEAGGEEERGQAEKVSDPAGEGDLEKGKKASDQQPPAKRARTVGSGFIHPHSLTAATVAASATPQSATEVLQPMVAPPPSSPVAAATILPPLAGGVSHPLQSLQSLAPPTATLGLQQARLRMPSAAGTSRMMKRMLSMRPGCHVSASLQKVTASKPSPDSHPQSAGPLLTGSNPVGWKAPRIVHTHGTLSVEGPDNTVIMYNSSLPTPGLGDKLPARLHDQRTFYPQRAAGADARAGSDRGLSSASGSGGVGLSEEQASLPTISSPNKNIRRGSFAGLLQKSPVSESHAGESFGVESDAASAGLAKAFPSSQHHHQQCSFRSAGTEEQTFSSGELVSTSARKQHSKERDSRSEQFDSRSVQHGFRSEQHDSKNGHSDRSEFPPQRSKKGDHSSTSQAPLMSDDTINALFDQINQGSALMSHCLDTSSTDFFSKFVSTGPQADSAHLASSALQNSAPSGSASSTSAPSGSASSTSAPSGFASSSSTHGIRSSVGPQHQSVLTSSEQSQIMDDDREWTREEDKFILETVRDNGCSPRVYLQIGDRIQRSTHQVSERLSTLMELLDSSECESDQEV